MEIKVTGIEAIDKALKELSKTAVKKVMRKAMREALRPTLAAAKANAPEKTGDLRQSIKLRSIKKSRKYFGVKVEMSKGDFRGDQFYGAFQEYGWHAGKRGNANRPEIEGKHFMENAYDQTKDSVQETALTLIQQGIDAEVARLKTT